MTDHGYPPPKESKGPDALLLLEGGHTTLLKGIPVQQAVTDIKEFVEDHGHGPCYFQPDNKPFNSVVVMTNKVVAIVAQIL